jgi:hypothetical protein
VRITNVRALTLRIPIETPVLVGTGWRISEREYLHVTHVLATVHRPPDSSASPGLVRGMRTIRPPCSASGHTKTWQRAAELQAHERCLTEALPIGLDTVVVKHPFVDGGAGSLSYLRELGA